MSEEIAVVRNCGIFNFLNITFKSEGKCIAISEGRSLDEHSLRENMKSEISSLLCI